MSIFIQSADEILADVASERKDQLLFFARAKVPFIIVDFLLNFFLVELSPLIFGHPNIAELDQRSKDASLQFIDEVVHLVRALDEPGLVGLDAELHFDHDLVPVHDVDQDILGHS